MPDNKIISTLKSFLTKERLTKIENVLDNRTDSLTIVLDHISHEHNISAVIRSADAFGISTIHIINEKQKLHSADFSEGISLGSEKWINLAHHNNYNDLISHLKSKNYSLVALLPPEKSAKSVPISTLDFEKPLALLFGNEVRGLSNELINQADIHAYIPMFGFAESLNISVSCAIALYSSTISKSMPEKRTKKLDETIWAEMFNDWVRKSVNNVELIEKNLAKR